MITNYRTIWKVPIVFHVSFAINKCTFLQSMCLPTTVCGSTCGPLPLQPTNLLFAVDLIVPQVLHAIQRESIRVQAADGEPEPKTGQQDLQRLGGLGEFYRGLKLVEGCYLFWGLGALFCRATNRKPPTFWGLPVGADAVTRCGR